MKPGSIPGNAFPKKERNEVKNNMFKFKIIRSRSMGYALFTFNDEGMFWVQSSKWYAYYGNLKRFCLDANLPTYYTIID